MNVRIVCVRHPEKSGDSITAHGAEQAFAAAAALAGMGYNFQRVFVSGAHRTEQAAKVSSAALDLDLGFEKEVGLHFGNTANQYFTDDAACLAEIKDIKTAHDGKPTLGDAVPMSAYVRAGRKHMSETLISLAIDMAKKDQKDALAFSHSPWLELAADLTTTPYGLGEADAIEYNIEADSKSATIINTRLIKAPLPGKTN